MERTTAVHEIVVDTILPDLLQQKVALQNRLSLSAKNLLNQYPISHYVSCLDAIPPYSSYHYVSSDIQQICSQISTGWNEQTLDTYHRLLLIHLIEGFERRPKLVAIPSSIMELYEMEFKRIVKELGSNPCGFYLFPNQSFCKDLALCRLLFVPIGSQAVEAASGISRGLLLKGGLKQFFKGLKFFLLHTKGFKPFFQIHLDSRKGEDFNASERTHCYFRIAELLRMNPQVKGLFGGSWFYDPKIERISPRLAYLRRYPEAFGATTFYNGSNEQDLTHALTKSPTRRQYYEKGQYLPANYILVWPRQNIINWAEQYRDTSDIKMS